MIFDSIYLAFLLELLIAHAYLSATFTLLLAFPILTRRVHSPSVASLDLERATPAGPPERQVPPLAPGQVLQRVHLLLPQLERVDPDLLHRRQGLQQAGGPGQARAGQAGVGPDWPEVQAAEATQRVAGHDGVEVGGGGKVGDVALDVQGSQSWGA